MTPAQQVALDAMRSAWPEEVVARMLRAESGELERLARSWATQRGYPHPTDHACRECWPGGSLVSKTFLCLRHLAEALPEQIAPEWDLASPLTSPAEEEHFER